MLGFNRNVGDKLINQKMKEIELKHPEKPNIKELLLLMCRKNKTNPEDIDIAKAFRAFDKFYKIFENNLMTKCKSIKRNKWMNKYGNLSLTICDNTMMEVFDRPERLLNCIDKAKSLEEEIETVEAALGLIANEILKDITRDETAYNRKHIMLSGDYMTTSFRSDDPEDFEPTNPSETESAENEYYNNNLCFLQEVKPGENQQDMDEFMVYDKDFEPEDFLSENDDEENPEEDQFIKETTDPLDMPEEDAQPEDMRFSPIVFNLLPTLLAKLSRRESEIVSVYMFHSQRKMYLPKEMKAYLMKKYNLTAGNMRIIRLRAFGQIKISILNYLQLKQAKPAIEEHVNRKQITIKHNLLSAPKDLKDEKLFIRSLSDAFKITG